MNVLIWFFVGIGLVIAVVNRYRQKQKEDFDQRDN
jgi:preprotein translocase subunit SecG